MWIVTVYKSRKHLKFDEHAKELKPYEREFTDQPTANRFAQNVVEGGHAWFAKVEAR